MAFKPVWQHRNGTVPGCVRSFAMRPRSPLLIWIAGLLLIGLKVGLVVLATCGALLAVVGVIALAR